MAEHPLRDTSVRRIGPREWRLRELLCEHGIHWPIRFSERAYGDGYNDPYEPGWACDFCGHCRAPYRWPLWAARGFVQHPVWVLREVGWRGWWGRPW